MATANQKRHDSVLSWGAQRTGSGQRELTDLEPASGEHNKATQNALNGYYSTDEPSLNSFVYTKKPLNNGVNPGGNNNSNVAGTTKKRAMSAFERHRPRTPMGLRRQKQLQQQQQDAAQAEEELLFEEGTSSNSYYYYGPGSTSNSTSTSLLGKATRVFSFPFSSNRKNPLFSMRSVSPTPSAPVSTSSNISISTMAAKSNTSKSLPSTASRHRQPVSSSMSLSMSLSTSRSGYNNNSINNTPLRSLPRPTFPRSHVAHISKRSSGTTEARILQAEAELKDQREKNARLKDEIASLERNIAEKEGHIPDVQRILKAALEAFEDNEKIVKYRLHEALKKPQ